MFFVLVDGAWFTRKQPFIVNRPGSAQGSTSQALRGAVLSTTSQKPDATAHRLDIVLHYVNIRVFIL
jgi:hypothetical protein